MSFGWFICLLLLVKCTMHINVQKYTPAMNCVLISTHSWNVFHPRDCVDMRKSIHFHAVWWRKHGHCIIKACICSIVLHIKCARLLSDASLSLYWNESICEVFLCVQHLHRHDAGGWLLCARICGGFSSGIFSRCQNMWW